MLGKYDHVIKHHLEFSKRNETYLRLKVHNDLISALSDCTSHQIVDNVKNAKYYSLILDGTIDISRTDQCSLSIRYVSSTGTPEEHFYLMLEEGAGGGCWRRVLEEGVGGGCWRRVLEEGAGGGCWRRVLEEGADADDYFIELD